MLQEQDNLRSSLRWCIDAGAAETALRLGVAVSTLRYTRGLYAEGRAWLAEALAVPDAAAPSALRAHALALAGHLASLLGDLSGAEALLSDGITTAQHVGATFEEARGWHFLGNVARRRGALRDAAGRYERALTLARAAHRPGVEAWAASMSALAQYELNAADGLRTALSVAVQVAKTVEDPRLHAILRILQSWLAKLEGDGSAALEFVEDGIRLARSVGDQEALTFGYQVRALNALDRGYGQDAAEYWPR
jgi:hypothetical protein